MDTLYRTRFLAANYGSLQGLKQVPFGVLAVAVSLWANTIRKPATDLSLPIVFTVISLVLYAASRRYYDQVFGRVQQTVANSRLEWGIQIVGSILAVIAFVADSSNRLPVSMLGLVFSLVFLADYVRITRFSRGGF